MTTHAQQRPKSVAGRVRGPQITNPKQSRWATARAHRVLAPLGLTSLTQQTHPGALPPRLRQRSTDVPESPRWPPRPHERLQVVEVFPYDMPPMSLGRGSIPDSEPVHCLNKATDVRV